MSALFPALAPSGRLRRPVERILVVQAGFNPSVDYYLAPRLAIDSVPYRICDLNEADRLAADDPLWSGALVLFCRYLSASWLALVEHHRAVLAGVALFLDDDIDALMTDWTMPVWYRLRLYRRHLRYRTRLSRNLDLLLVSNARIAIRHHGAPFTLLKPISTALDEPEQHAGSGPLRVAFHATSVHRREHLWLREVVRRALDKDPSLQIEVVATAAMSVIWRGLPNTRVKPPAPWPTFRAETRASGADLLLSPLLPSAANAARAPTKRIDALRLGAGLLVSDTAVYGPTDEEQQLGMRVELHPEAWAQTIVELAHDRERLARLRDLNRAIVEGWNGAARSLGDVLSEAGFVSERSQLQSLREA